MGLLTNPNTSGANKLLLLLQKHNGKVGIFSYVLGLVWLMFLANQDYNLGTYFSENALLPGLVVEHFDGGDRVDVYLDLLNRMEDVGKGRMRNEDLVAVLKNVGFLEAEIQNYTLIHPVTTGDPETTTYGANVFAVLRGKRAPGTESVVFNAPYFSKNSAGRRNLVGIATMLALAEYFYQQVYWAKDIVFLVAEGHTGSLAWVKGHQEIRDNNQNLLVESVRTKVGNIQAAINFIVEGTKVCNLETKFHGVNGQLPNLDLVNLLNKFVVSDYEKRSSWEADIWKLVNYMQTQAVGTPTGSHGFFLRYGIESVTLIGRSGKSCRRGMSFGDIGRILEATFRSLNNLLERFHQSFFFYLKTTPNRFVSIGLYSPPLALILLAIPMKAAAIWLTETDLEATNGLFYVGAVHGITIGCRWLLSHLHQVFPSLDVTPELFTHIVLGMALLQLLAAQLLLVKANRNLVSAVYCFTLLEYATALFSLALFNPSLVFIVGTCTVPLVTLFFLAQPGKRTWLSIGILAILIGCGTYANMLFQEEFIQPWITKYFYEAEIYGNFLFDFTFVIGLPVLSCILASV